MYFAQLPGPSPSGLSSALAVHSGDLPLPSPAVSATSCRRSPGKQSHVLALAGPSPSPQARWPLQILRRTRPSRPGQPPRAWHGCPAYCSERGDRATTRRTRTNAPPGCRRTRAAPPRWRQARHSWRRRAARRCALGPAFAGHSRRRRTRTTSQPRAACRQAGEHAADKVVPSRRGSPTRIGTRRPRLTRCFTSSPRSPPGSHSAPTNSPCSRCRRCSSPCRPAQRRSTRRRARTGRSRRSRRRPFRGAVAAAQRDIVALAIARVHAGVVATAGCSSARAPAASSTAASRIFGIASARSKARKTSCRGRELRLPHHFWPGLQRVAECSPETQ